VKKRAAKPLQLQTQTLRTLTDDALALIVGGLKSEVTYDQGCESPNR
jgi:hypothetical protein